MPSVTMSFSSKSGLLQNNKAAIFFKFRDQPVIQELRRYYERAVLKNVKATIVARTLAGVNNIATGTYLRFGLAPDQGSLTHNAAGQDMLCQMPGFEELVLDNQTGASRTVVFDTASINGIEWDLNSAMVRFAHPRFIVGATHDITQASAQAPAVTIATAQLSFDVEFSGAGFGGPVMG
jgi:hypothetical protein